MARILLIKPPWDAFQGCTSERIPLSLCYLGAILRNAGHFCCIFDGDLGQKRSLATHKQENYGDIIINYEQYLKALREDHPVWGKTRSVIKHIKPDIVGITMMTGTYGSALRVAKIVKGIDPEIHVVIGGPHPTILPEDTLREDYLDIVVRGEGEYSLLELVNYLEKGNSLDNVQGISYKEGEIIHHNSPRPLIKKLDSLPFPARDLVLEKEKYSPDSFGFIFTSRGCPYRCIFCASYKIWGRRVRNRSPDNVVAEIREVIEKFGTRIFRFHDDAFTLYRNRVFKICELIIRMNLNIKWYCDTRVDLLSHNLLAKMKEAGCEGINLGVESGNPYILKSIKKGITLDQARKALKMTKEVGISSLVYFMLGFPNEGHKEIMDTVSFMKEIKPDNVCWSVATPYPETELYEIGKEKGLLPNISDWSAFFHHSPDMIMTDKISKEDFLSLIKEVKLTIDTEYSDFSYTKKYFLTPSLFFYRLKRHLICRQPKLIFSDLNFFVKALYRKIKTMTK